MAIEVIFIISETDSHGRED